jgi:hypothetical protein
MTKAEFMQKAILVIKKLTTYATIVGALVIGFYVGRWNKTVEPKVEINPYKRVYSDTEISIAVNENNELLMVDKKTGKYVVYSDQVGQTIFKMYTNRIYQQASGNE